MNFQTVRERLTHYNASNLTNSELLSIITRADTDTTTDVLKKIGSISELPKMSLQELQNIFPKRAAEILHACITISIRASQANNTPEYIRSPREVYELMFELQHKSTEHFYVICMNTKNRITRKELCSKGSLNATVVHPREVFNIAITNRASAIIVCHNHPSGDATPSREDIEMTKRLKEAGEVIGIDVLDHVIIGNGTFTSLKEQGFM